MIELLTELQAKGKALREELPRILESLSPEEMTEEAIKRGEFKNDCNRIYNALKDKISDMESHLRLIRQMKSEQTTDIDKLDSQKWTLITSRKSHGA